MLSAKNYKFKAWNEIFPDNIVKLSFPKESSWYGFMEGLLESKDFKKIEQDLTEELEEKKQMYPYPDLVFYGFEQCDFKNLKVVILGQDPYHQKVNGVPQAMGMSFSVPSGVELPSSLQNIFKNMVKYKHLKEIPKDGNLEHLAKQGCLFLNCALTVPDSQPNYHSLVWSKFTDSVIEKISKECKNVVFVLWGSFALKKIKLIDVEKHGTVISSHPSGLSCYRTLQKYPAFDDFDVFGEVNKQLTKFGKTVIKY